MIYMTVAINGAGTVCSSAVFEFTSSFSMILATQIVHFLRSAMWTIVYRCPWSIACPVRRITVSGTHLVLSRRD
jgi:hypothetical protein